MRFIFSFIFLLFALPNFAQLQKSIAQNETDRQYKAPNNLRDTNQVRKLNMRINSKYPEFSPSLSADGETLYFTRRINGVNEDFYYAKPDTCGGWLSARNLGYPPNTANNESSFTITADDHYLFFMRSDNRSENGWERGGYDLYLAYRKAIDSPWSVPQSFGATINTPAFEGMPSLSPDIIDLYFASNRPGGYGGMDIWVSHFSFGLWQMPVNLGAKINTSGNETSPFISSDNSTLYFASDGHLGLGGIDLFRSKKVMDTLWEQAENLGAPFNSEGNDHSVFICANGQNAFFASDRGNKHHDLDIYETTLPQRLAPANTAFALCYVYDSITKERALLGSIQLFDSLGNELALYHSNKGDGSILLSLPLGKTFYFNVRGFNYQSFEGSISFPEACPKWCVLNFALLSNDYVRPTFDSTLLTVFYPKNETNLLDSQIAEIVDRLAFWKDKLELTIYINSYTDNTGTPMINIEKSTERANKITAALEKAGFSKDKIVATGFGDVNELVPNDSPENQDKNRRADIVVRWAE